uniref:Ig-like domain-containing protein n=1 Tax=Electrophorus electricus TaxID=8005 RepID=A0A4W4DRW2_ELEEL
MYIIEYYHLLYKCHIVISRFMKHSKAVFCYFKLKTDDGILWTFGTRNTCIAQIVNRKPSTHYDEIFRNRLQLDTQTIHNISITHSGVYKLQITSNDVSTKQFSVTVYAMLPVPNITRASHSETKSSVTLSWYKGNHVISTISDSKTSSLFLPLEVEYHDKNTYSCVAANLVSNETAQLNIISICKHVSGMSAKAEHIYTYNLMSHRNINESS